MNERRSARRHQIPANTAHVAVKLRPGREARLLDLSSNGVRIESVARLVPGAPIDVQLLADGETRTIRGQLVWARVSRLKAERVWYEGAVRFETSLQVPSALSPSPSPLNPDR